MVAETFKYRFPLDKSMVEGYGPLSTLHEVEDRLSTGIPLTSFEFQRSFRVVNSHMAVIRMRVSKGADVSQAELDHLEYLTHLQEQVLHLRPRVIGPLGGISGAERQVRSYRQERARREQRGRL